MLRRFALLVLTTCLWACGAAKPASPPQEKDVGPLVELLPPGPSPIVVARPRKLFEHEVVRMLWTTLVSAEDERAFVERTQVDPRTLDELVLFELPRAGYVLMARGPFSSRAVIEHAATRFSIPDVNVDEPFFRREGVTGIARYAYAALDAHALLVAKNAPPALVATILARIADRKLPRAFDLGDAAALYHETHVASCVLLAPKPLELAPGGGAALLLAEERALSASAEPEAGALRVEVRMRGDFPQGAEQNFERLVLSVAQAPLGQLLGLADVAHDLKIARAPWGVQIAFRWPTQRLALGLRALFMEDLRSLMR
jgi:hypothetical protein